MAEIDVPTRFAGIERLRRAGLWDQVIDEIDGRRIRIGSRWLVDFASCNYLGLDLEPEIADAIDAAVRRWGTHPSRSRMLGSPRPYPEIEERLTELLRAPDVLALPTISQIHLGVVPALAGPGATIFVDAHAHRTIYTLHPHTVPEDPTEHTTNSDSPAGAENVIRAGQAA